jgi:MFS family permease
LNNNTIKTFLIVCLPFGLAYFLSYFYRSVNAVISDTLATDVGLSASGLGLLTAAYFFGFAAFQLPLGILLDRYGPRWVQGFLVLVAATGAGIFSLGESEAVLMFGRALIGVGVAGGLMASFKAITIWFPPERWPLINGIFMALGGLGAVAATSPVHFAVDAIGWRAMFQVLGAITVGVALVIVFVVPRHPTDRAGGTERLTDKIAGLKKIYTDRLFWRVAPVAVVAMGAGLAIQGLWAGPWLRDVAHLDSDGVAEHLFVLTVALTLGFIATGIITGFLARFGITKLGVIGIGAVLMMLIMGLLMLELTPRGYWVWGLFGFFSNLGVVCYPALSEHFGTAYAGRANTACNLLLFGAAFGFQFLIGSVLDLWPTTAAGGYASEGYVWAFGIVNILLVVTFIWYLVPHQRRE